MSNTQTLKMLSNRFGTEVVGIQTTFAMSASKANDVRNQYLKLIQDRNIPKTQMQEFENVDENFFVITKTIEYSELATSAVRIEPYGNDLWVEARHYESSAKSRSNKALWGILLTGGGLLFIWTGIGFFVFLAGIGMFFTKPQFPDPGATREASKLLFETVIETVVVALTNCDVDAEAQIKSDF